VAISSAIGRTVHDQSAAEPDAKMHIEEIVERLGYAKQRLPERARDAIYTVEDLQARGVPQLIQYREILPALDNSRANKADVGLNQRPRKRHPDAENTLRRTGTPHEFANDALHGCERSPLITCVDVHLAPAEDVPDEVNQRGGRPSGLQANS